MRRLLVAAALVVCLGAWCTHAWGEWARTDQSYVRSEPANWRWGAEEEDGTDDDGLMVPSPSPSPSPNNCTEPGDEGLTPTQIASRVFGGASIACWIFVTAPQLWRNYKNGTAEALAFGFIMCWVMGDLSNLLGCILTGQLLTQTALAVYYMFADAFMVAQVVYYKIRDSRRKYATLTDSYYKDGPDAALVESPGHLQGASRKAAGAGASSSGGSSGSAQLMAGAVVAASLSNVAKALSACDSDTEDDKEGRTKHIIGITFAWTSAVLYLSSRVPQVVKNFKRRSTDGLSFGMFVLTVSGNLTYAASIFLESLDPEYLYNELPYLVGSLGTLSFDLIVWGQFFVYGSITPKKDLYDVEDVPPPPQYQPKTINNLRTNYYDRLAMQQGAAPTVSLPVRNEFGEIITTV